MIYTITFNPAIDLVVKVQTAEHGASIRSVENYVASGRALICVCHLEAFRVRCTATGFLADFSGSFIKEALQAEGIHTNFIEIDGVTRINLKQNCRKRRNQREWPSGESRRFCSFGGVLRRKLARRHS